MMQVAIDPSERRDAGSRKPVADKVVADKPVAARPVKPGSKLGSKPAARGRMVVLGTLGCVVVAGLSYAAYSAMGSLAGPQVARPNLYQMQKAQALQAKAADWPDLRDGVPALASAAGSPAPARETGIQLVERRALVEEPAKAEASSKVQLTAPVEATAKVEAPPKVDTPVTLAAATPAPSIVKAEAPRPKALPPIEPVSLALPPNALSPIVPNRVASVIAPSAAQTIRARSAATSFASLPPEPARAEAGAETTKPSASVVVKPAASVAKPSVAVAKPKPAKPAKPVQEASAEPAAAPAAAPEPEQSEIFGLKVPSLAPAGRKIAESVEALGNAVKNLPNQF
ncbi:hypothetical protein [Methylobacterium sp. WCS2018Hpa-22]|uniref:hypothetical protein n=1 Tax=Methylobacterium sp. WCS2018Hpa-22 TaxID=3073633 RepID=UPI00288AFFC8|nr:hypothetical protein [Methylobacterium sp. WCS2018Hpa-22]